MAAAASSTSGRRWYEARRSRTRGGRNHGGINDIVRTHRRMIIDDGTRASRHQVRGVTQPDPAPPKPASRAWRMAPDRSETCSSVMMLDTWLRNLFEAHPKRLAASVLSRARGQQPQDLGLTLGELGRRR